MPRADLLSYANYDSSYLNRYPSHTIDGFFAQNPEPLFESEQVSTSFVQTSRKRKFQEETISKPN